jgi:DNA mismatch endonuclease (patch repair protein)
VEEGKLEENAVRDEQKKRELRKLGWRALTVWECETEKPEKLRRRLERLMM